MNAEDYPEMTNEEYREAIIEITNEIEDSQTLRYLYIIATDIKKEV